MYNTDRPARHELPSTGQLIRSTVIAAVIAVVLLLTVVLPAEYALDPTGAGRILGLTEMGEIKEQLAEEAAADQAAEAVAVEPDTEKAPEATETPAKTEEPASQSQAAPATEPQPTETQWRDEIRVELSPGEGTEYKLTMEEGDVARYSWVAEGGPINYDTHGNGSGQAISYEKGRGVPEDEGELEAAFTGKHGWFFRNRNDDDITLVLRVRGDYGELTRLK